MAADLFDLSVLGDSGDAIEFVTSLLRVATGYSIVGLSLDGTIVLWSEGARRQYGYEPAEVVGRASMSVLHVAEDIAVDLPREILRAALARGLWEGRVRRRRKNGEQFLARMVVAPRYDAGGEAAGYILISHDLSEELLLAGELEAELDARRRVETALRESEQRYRILASTASDAIISLDEHHLIVFANPAVEKIFGHSPAGITGQSISQLIPDLPPHLRDAGACAGVEMSGRRRDGRVIPLEVSVGEYRGDGRHLFTITVHDIAERKHAEERIRYLAQHDALTGLPNRVLFQDRVGRAIAQARRNREKVAVLFLDLDGFKHINDSLGHPVGDELLRHVGRRLLRCLREGDTVGRVGGDEFMICLPVRVDDRDAVSIAAKILDTLRKSFFVNENELHIGASIGISLYPTDGDDPDALMRAADTAMYHAKDKGRNNFQFFTQRLNDAAQRRLQIANHLHRALRRGEFSLAYQPQVELASGRILAAEALLRWSGEQADAPLPTEFIKVAEDTGLIVPIGTWVLREACRQLRRWRAAGHTDLRVAVNLSPEQFRQPGFADTVLDALREAGVPAVALDLEITEGILMTQSSENLDMLARLAGAGVQLAVDDFGTGYSSFAYLQRFPIDTIKIDRSFVDGVVHDRNDSGIVTAMIAMAKNLKLHVVAEGVETAEQAAFLHQHGCLAAQGFFFYQPVSAEAVSALLE